MNDVLMGRLEAGLRQLAQQPIGALALAKVSQAQRQRLVALVLLLAKWNRVYNLTAVRDPLEMIDRHVLDSLVMARWLPDVATGRPVDSPASERLHDVMDIGTGAGLPVLPLAVLRPDLAFLSIESNGKKTRFQQQAVMELAIDNVTILNDRVENVSGRASLVMSRAFTAPERFLQIADSLCAEQGSVAIMLGHAERMPSTLPGGFELAELCEVIVPGTESARHVALCRRRAG